MSVFIERYLDKYDSRPFNDSSLLGPLADNIMTIGSVAGRFITCESCGTSSVLAGTALICSSCSVVHELKPDPTFRGPTKKADARLLVRGAKRPGVAKGNNWFADGENWTVADLFSSFLRLPMSKVLSPFLASLSLLPEENTGLERILFWPRLIFGDRTIQPDVVIVFDKEIILMEFKRPSGATVPPIEISGQIAFASMVSFETDLDWKLLVVPGPRKRIRKASRHFVEEAINGMDQAQEKWNFGEEVREVVSKMSINELTSRVVVQPWEEVIQSALFAASKADPDQWETVEVIRSLKYLQESRQGYGWVVD